MVKLLNRFDQTHVAFLNQVEEQHAAPNITFGDTYDEPQVCFSKPAFCFLIAVLDSHRQFYLVISRQQRHATDLLQIHPDRVIDLDSGRE
ncbi:hypothetical protein D3C74_451350 [compost metagenome]